jgi:MFS family permease
MESGTISKSFVAINRDELPRRSVLATALGFVQILSWGSSYYLLAVLAKPIVADTGWSLSWVVGGLSLGLLAGGVVSPWLGRVIEHHGGRLVLASSSILFALGLGGLGLAQSLVVYLAAWLVIGFAMGGGLYDAAFATLGRIYGQNARPAISMLTLFGGLASTVCWPLTAFLAAELGWRGACLVYAVLHLAVDLPLNLLVLPRGRLTPPEKGDRAAPATIVKDGPSGRKKTTRFVLLAAIIALGEALFSMISVHLLSILQLRGMDLMAAVALGSLIGPAQVGARTIEMAFGRFYHPLWTMIASTALVAVGIALLLVQFPIAAVALIIYGGGVGLASIARGTVPLELFGPLGYASLMGRLALPCLLAQALSPSLASFLMVHGDADLALAIVMGASLANVVLVALLWMVAKASR